jgi:hypothetical protein
MKIQLDTIEKVIKIDEQVCLGELYDFVEQLLPNNVWREFKIEVNSIILWRDNPIIYPNPLDLGYPTPVQPGFPNPWQPWITWCNGVTGEYTLCEGVYDVLI